METYFGWYMGERRNPMFLIFWKLIWPNNSFSPSLSCVIQLIIMRFLSLSSCIFSNGSEGLHVSYHYLQVFLGFLRPSSFNRSEGLPSITLHSFGDPMAANFSSQPCTSSANILLFRKRNQCSLHCNGLHLSISQYFTHVLDDRHLIYSLA